MGFWRRFGGRFYKTSVVLLGLAIVFYILIEFRLWSADWTTYLLRTWKVEEYIFISLVVAGVSIVVLGLFKWFLRWEMR